MKTIKKLELKDLELFQQLLVIFMEVFEEKSISIQDLPSKTYLKSLLLKDDFIVFVALLNNKVVGGLTAHIWPSYLTEGKEIYIYDIAVTKEYRRAGVARALIIACQKYAGKKGINSLWVQAFEEDEIAVKFYLSLGLKMEKVKHFEIDPLL